MLDPLGLELKLVGNHYVGSLEEQLMFFTLGHLSCPYTFTFDLFYKKVSLWQVSFVYRDVILFCLFGACLFDVIFVIVSLISKADFQLVM